MTYVIVLAERIHEANLYAKRAGLPRGRFRFPASASSIRNLRVAEIHELPSFSRRRDRHAIDAELRFAKGERKLVEMPAAPEQPAVDQGDGMGEQLNLVELLDRQNDILEQQRDLALEGDSQTSLDMAAAVDDRIEHNETMIKALVEVSSTHGEETGAPEPREDIAPAPKAKRKPAAKNFFEDD